jgi:hypothetical protein
MSARLPLPATVLDRYEIDDLVAILGDGEEKPPTRRTIERWITQGVPMARADHVAIRLHSYPTVLWDADLFPPVTMPADDDDYSDLIPANERNPR